MRVVRSRASATVPARANGPSSSMSPFNVSGWRDENITRCPALTKSAPSAPPSRPAPMVLMLRGCYRPAPLEPAQAKTSR